MNNIITLKRGRKPGDDSIKLSRIANGDTDYFAFFDKQYRVIEFPTNFSFYLSRTGNYSPRTNEEYSKIIRDFLLFLKYNEDLNNQSFDSAITACGPLQLENYLSDLKTLGKKSKTIRTRDACLKSFFDWLTTEEGGKALAQDDNPYSSGRLKSKTPFGEAIKYLTYLEFIDFCQLAFDNEFDRCVAHFMFDTGARISEVARVKLLDLPDLNSHDMDQVDFTALIHGSKSRGGKIKDRYSFISRPVLSRILRMTNNYPAYKSYASRVKETDRLLFIQKDSKPINTRSYQMKMWRAWKRLIKAGKLRRAVSCHMFRHGTAMSILNSEYGKDISDKLIIIKNMFGHVLQSTADIYTTIPLPIIDEIKRDANRKQIFMRFQEAEYIYEKTMLKYS